MAKSYQLDSHSETRCPRLLTLGVYDPSVASSIRYSGLLLHAPPTPERKAKSEAMRFMWIEHMTFRFEFPEV